MKNDTLAEAACSIAQRGAVEYLHAHSLKADAYTLAECLKAHVKSALPGALHDAKQALDCNMGQAAQQAFAADMVLAGIEAAKEAGYREQQGEIIGYEISADALLAASTPDTRPVVA